MPLANVNRGVRIFMVRSLFLLLLIPATSLAQFGYKIDQSIPVEIDGNQLAMPWAGGLNSAQINKMDFDGDGKEDLVIYDRAGGKILTYRNAGDKYEYTPDYEVLFPETVSAWMLLRDFNCDGKKDLFTSDPFGIVAFVNITQPGQPLAWREFNPGFPLLTKGFSGNINLKINDVDIPAIDDVDNDGDLDILAMRFVGIGTIEWHKNMSIENTGKCDSLQLERVTQTYGKVEECFCGQFAFGGNPCDGNGGGRVQHVGGKALLNIDIDNDGDNDVLYAEETCTNLYVFTNVGDKNNPSFIDAKQFPGDFFASFQYFPAPYFEDVDFDGLKDLVVSPNLYSRQYDNIIVKNSVWFYKNTGTADQPQFTFTQKNFLQEDMIDVGDYSSPALIDTDNDGDLDLFIGYYSDTIFRGSIYYFENVGTAAIPSFKQTDDDFGAISFLQLFNVKPQAVDMDGDGRIDLAFTATDNKLVTSLYYIPNKSDAGFEPNFSAFRQTSFAGIGPTENVYVTDVNQDGTPDILLGKGTGALYYFENNSNDGLFGSTTLKSSQYLGLDNSTSRQNPSVVIEDLDADGVEDLIMSDQKGRLNFYPDYRNFDPLQTDPVTEAIYNDLQKEYNSVNLGGRVRLAVGNLFNSDRPAIVVGNTMGGLMVLRNDDANILPDDPVVRIGRNPLDRGEDLQIRSDRNTKVQIYSTLGQKMSDLVPVPANQTFTLPLKELAAGMYVARFVFLHKHVSIKFIIK
jgi:hypothetical protein